MVQKENAVYGAGKNYLSVPLLKAVAAHLCCHTWNQVHFPFHGVAATEGTCPGLEQRMKVAPSFPAERATGVLLAMAKVFHGVLQVGQEICELYCLYCYLEKPIVCQCQTMGHFVRAEVDLVPFCCHSPAFPVLAGWQLLSAEYLGQEGAR